MARGYTFFSRSTGVEIKDYVKQGKKQSIGMVRLRFFAFSEGKLNNQFHFLMKPEEAYTMAEMMKQTYKTGKPFSLVHSFETKNGEKIVSKVTCEYWKNNNRSGFALILSRGNEKINVPFDAIKFLFASELLKELSLQTAWFEPVRPNLEQKKAIEQEVEEIPVIDKIDEKEIMELEMIPAEDEEVEIVMDSQIKIQYEEEQEQEIEKKAEKQARPFRSSEFRPSGTTQTTIERTAAKKPEQIAVRPTRSEEKTGKYTRTAASEENISRNPDLPAKDNYYDEPIPF